jgi:hypothetical protein
MVASPVSPVRHCAVHCRLWLLIKTLVKGAMYVFANIFLSIASSSLFGPCHLLADLLAHE